MSWLSYECVVIILLFLMSVILTVDFCLIIIFDDTLLTHFWVIAIVSASLITISCRHLLVCVTGSLLFMTLILILFINYLLAHFLMNNSLVSLIIFVCLASIFSHYLQLFFTNLISVLSLFLILVKRSQASLVWLSFLFRIPIFACQAYIFAHYRIVSFINFLTFNP